MKCRGALLAVLLFGALLCAAQTKPYAKSALEEGLALLREGHYEQALLRLQAAQRQIPPNASLETLMGVAETRLDRIAEANDHFRSAIRLAPAQAAPHRNLGFNLLGLHDYANAETELLQAAKLEPEDLFARYYLLLLYLATGREEKVLAYAGQVQSLLAADAEASAEVAETEIRARLAQQALQRVEQLESAHHIAPEREYRIAVLFRQHGLNAEALHCFRHLAEADPSPANRYNLALALLFDGKAAEAVDLLAVLRAEQPGNADVLTFLGAALEAEHKPEKALEVYRAAVAADPANADRRLDYTRLLMETDHNDEAIAAVQAGLDAGGAPGPLSLRLGAIEMLKGNYDAARDAFRAALVADASLDAAYVGLAQAYAHESKNAEAIRVLSEACTRFPDHYLLQYYFGLLSSRQGLEQQAVSALEQAIRLAPNASDPLFELGKIYSAREEWRRASELLERAVALDAQRIPAHFLLSRAYMHMGENAKGQQEAREIERLLNEQHEQAQRRQHQRVSALPVSPDPR